jgi:LmeA-like phospholipid-binding
VRLFLVLSLVAVGVLLLVVGLFSYLLLPGLIESRFAANLQERYGLEQKPMVEVSSNFPPELLLGRIDRIEVQIDQLTREGILLRDLRIDLKDVDVSVPSLLQGDLEREIRSGSLRAEVPEESINDYLRENDLGLEYGEINVLPQDVVYQISEDRFGLPASVSLVLRVSGPRTIEVIPQEATVGGYELPSFFTRSLASGGRTLTLSELPLGAELVSVEPSEEDALVVRAEKQ